jgi:phosphatidylglycerophosphatase A
VAQWLYRCLGSVGFAGYFPVAPGTVGSAVAIGAVWLLDWRWPWLFDSRYTAYHFAALAILTYAATVIATRARRAMRGNDPDPGPIVIDEFVGQLVALFLIPVSIRSMILAFFLFRFYDIIKPYPVHNLEEVEGGVGIVMDDVAAGVYAAVTQLVILWAYQAVRAALGS